MKKSLLILGTVVCFLGFLFSLAGIAMAIWISAVPGNSPEFVRFNFIFWVTCTVVTLLLTVLGVLVLLGMK